jgi:hypothetical protein
MELHEMVEAVSDRESFLRFVDALVRDREIAIREEDKTPSSPYGPDAGGWENTTIESYLEAATAWARDSAFGESQGLDRDNPWRQFAAFLYCGKNYE